MVIKFNFDNICVKNELFKNCEEKLISEVENLINAKSQNYETDYASINLCDDLSIIEDSIKLKNKLNEASTIIVIGIGGSSLGISAIVEGLYGNYYNTEMEKNIYFADTVDSDKISSISNIIKKKLKNGEKVILNGISKSGGTTEAISNFNVLLEVVKENAKYDYEDYVVITTGVNSKFENYGKKEKFNILNLPSKVGGRYSVLSNVGVFPLAFLDIDIKELFRGASDIRKICLEKDINKNPALMGASFIYQNNLEGRNICDTFLFSTKLESIGKWYKQLLGESIGKEFNKEGKEVFTGITPTVSIGSTDLHSTSQLYIGGPDDKMYVFVKTNEVKEVNLEKNESLFEIVPNIRNKKMSDIMDAIYMGTKDAFIQRKRPFYEIIIDEINEYSIGTFLQMKMIEIMYLGALFNVNPFDQPNVEEYKIITKKYLEK